MLNRRNFLKRVVVMTTPGLAATLAGCGNASDKPLSCAAGLARPDDNGLCLVSGFSSSIIARSGQTVANSDYQWHGSPDGGACLSTEDGGWIYVSNSELPRGKGGAGAIRFDQNGRTVSAYSILHNANRPCAGGLTPWGTWLACEEVSHGRVWECDPLGKKAAIDRDALGRFAHEAAVYDLQQHHIYLTEDKGDGGLYRFVPDGLDADGRANLARGQLQVAVFANSEKNRLSWVAVPDPLAQNKETRRQVKNMAVFNGGEGLVYKDGSLYFSTKGDDRIWRCQTHDGSLSVIYDAANYKRPVLTGVDNMALSSKGSLYVAEDGGDLQIVRIGLSASGEAQGEPEVIMQLPSHTDSEISGLAFTPDGSRLYFSSQRGLSGKTRDGMIFEIRGNFL